MPEGTVISQSPKDGTVDIGGTVKITVAQKAATDPDPDDGDAHPDARPRREPDADSSPTHRAPSP